MTKAAILGKMLTWLCTCGHMLDHSSGLVQPHNLCRFGTDPPPTQQCSEKGTLCPHCEEACVVATGRQEVDAPSEDPFQGNMLGPILSPKPIWIAMRTLTMLRYIFLGGFELDILLSFVKLERGDPNIQR